MYGVNFEKKKMNRKKYNFVYQQTKIPFLFTGFIWMEFLKNILK